VILLAPLGEPAAVAGWYLLASTLVAGLTLAWAWGGRQDIAALAAGEGEPPSPLRRTAAAALPWFYIAVAVLIWIVGRIAAEHPDGARWGAAAGLTQILLVVLPILAAGAGALVETVGTRVLAGEATPGRMALVAVTRVVATSGIWIAGLAVLSGIWSDSLIDPDSEVAALILRAAVTVAASLVAAWALWTFLDTVFTAHAPRGSAALPGEEDEGSAPVQTRLATVLPLVRHLALGAIVAVTALAILAAVGVHIGPLLAGFGVIGLAISFGSQALVRDVVSGIFFMADDAFRVGEYIDTGRLKGTVEKITLRSVQLRHQNGPFHTVPFGQLQAITNYSRDWATIKFTIRLDRDADIEKARKVIKRVGQELMEDPDFGPEFMQPLKMQGVQEIADSAIVVRCKFTSKPTKPTWLQREALKRIHRALQEAGVPFASNAVTVRSGGNAELAAAASLPGAPPVAANAG
jgi:small-conductance mechanosensitive channel